MRARTFAEMVASLSPERSIRIGPALLAAALLLGCCASSDAAVLHRGYRAPYRTHESIVRPWVHHPYFGKVVHGVRLGALIDVSTQPPSPASGICWCWTTEARARGYWDYCTARP